MRISRKFGVRFNIIPPFESKSLLTKRITTIGRVEDEFRRKNLLYFIYYCLMMKMFFLSYWYHALFLKSISFGGFLTVTVFGCFHYPFSSIFLFHPTFPFFLLIKNFSSTHLSIDLFKGSINYHYSHYVRYFWSSFSGWRVHLHDSCTYLYYKTELFWFVLRFTWYKYYENLNKALVQQINGWLYFSMVHGSVLLCIIPAF